MEINDRDFFKYPFSREEIVSLLQGRPASEMFNFRSPSFKKVGVAKDALTGDQLMALMIKEPRLIRRPVVRVGENVYFGADSKFLAGIIT